MSAVPILYFAYGTLQQGFPNHAAHADDLGKPVGRFRTVAAYPLAVTTRPTCTNPGCRVVHHMCALLPDEGVGHHVEGDVYAIGPATLDRLDALEHYLPDDEAASTYVRRPVAVEPVHPPGPELVAETFFIAQPQAWRDLIASGDADLRTRYARDLAVGPLKRCCIRDPTHAGAHDQVDA